MPDSIRPAKSNYIMPVYYKFPAHPTDIFTNTPEHVDETSRALRIKFINDYIIKNFTYNDRIEDRDKLEEIAKKQMLRMTFRAFRTEVVSLMKWQRKS